MIILRGVDRFVSAVDLKVRQMQLATKLATSEALHLLERRIKLKLRTYTHQRGTPTPSGSGDPPALVSGNLRRGVQVGPPGGPENIGANRWRGWVGPTAVYGRIQELGGEIHTPSSSSMVMSGTPGSGIWLPARPYVRPALTESMGEIQAIFRRRWTEATLK